tara:strand:+ start:300 stop:407 length:108 start_codon:yes stop_codon:yes gene_type:complete
MDDFFKSENLSYENSDNEFKVLAKYLTGEIELLKK